MHQEIIEGTWKEVAKRAAGISQQAHVRLEVLGKGSGEMISKGMFPQLRALTEADFKGAEWQGLTNVDL